MDNYKYRMLTSVKRDLLEIQSRNSAYEISIKYHGERFGMESKVGISNKDAIKVALNALLDELDRQINELN